MIRPSGLILADRLPWLAGNAFPLYLAPMAGFTDTVFRSLCKRFGADVMVTEFVLAEAVLHGGEKVWEEIDFCDQQRPMGVQVFGCDPAPMAAAANRIRDRLQPDFIDLNFGCPAPRITNMKAGSSLLKDLPKLGRIARAVVRSNPEIPVTAKIRTGWDGNSIVALEAGKVLQDEGIRLLVIHGRTKEQGYKGDADWEIIGDVAGSLDIPVIGNGSIRDAEDVNRVRQETKVAGVMIGRAALGNPWIFREIKQILETGKAPEPPSIENRWEILLEYGEALSRRPLRVTRDGHLNWIRSRLKTFARDMPRCRQLRHLIDRVKTVRDLEILAEDYL